MGEAVSYEVRDRVALITIERPDVHNAMSFEVFDQLREQAERAGDDGTVGAVLLTGRGPSFSSGLDVSVMGEIGTNVDDAGIARLQQAFTAYEDLDKPTVAGIWGHCYGGGIQLAAACHVRLVAPSARFSVLERRWGLVPDLGGTVRIPRLIGLGRATELTLTARTFDADEAMANGFGQVRLDGDDPFEQAHTFARALAHGPGAVRRAPRLLRENVGRPREEALAAERAAQLACLAGPDVIEAVTAHLEGRDPVFVGD